MVFGKKIKRYEISAVAGRKLPVHAMVKVAKITDYAALDKVPGATVLEAGGNTVPRDYIVDMTQPTGIDLEEQYTIKKGKCIKD